MELREAIEEIHKAHNEFGHFLHLSGGPNVKSIDIILNAVADGTLIPTDQTVKVKPLEWYDYGKLDSPGPLGSFADGPGFECRIVNTRADGWYSYHHKKHFASLEAAKAAAQADYEKRIRSTLVPADVVFQVKEGYRITAQFLKTIYEDCGVWADVPLSEALEIRSADEVRREVLKDAASKGYYACAETRHVTLGNKVSDAILALIDAPKHRKGMSDA